jgi:hypothetical protein
MMSVSNSFLSTFFTSEGDLITRIMKDFLTIRDFCKFNTSLCNHEHRDNVLRATVLRATVSMGIMVYLETLFCIGLGDYMY